MVKRNIDQYLTPYKFGKPVLIGSNKLGRFDSLAVDIPFVFYHQNQFYMMYVGFDGEGYQTGLAISNDLINWHSKGPILKRDEHVGWDKNGAAGTWIIKNTNDLYALPTLKKIEGKYWMVYHSYPDKGYENGAAQIGLAWTEDEELMEWHRLPDPVYSYKDGADWEKGGLYKACLIENNGIYYLFYNAKNNTYGSWIEQIGVALSRDLINWNRYEGNPILKVQDNNWDSVFCSDPFVVKDKEKWLMFYYGYDKKHAQDGIAISDDLLTWEKYPEPILRYGAPGEIDELHAHKPALIYYNGILYHFYCACRQYQPGDPTKVGNEFRCISVATSKPIYI